MRINRLNDLDSKTWLKFQKSWFVHNPPPRKQGVLVHPANEQDKVAAKWLLKRLPSLSRNRTLVRWFTRLID